MKKSYKALSIALALIVALSGCTGAVLRSGMTDKVTYQETLDKLPEIDTGKGRAFIYFPKGGSDIANTIGVIDFISIDKDIYRFGGESYFYLDVASGPHHFTITEVVKAGLKNKKQFGKSKTDISVPEKDTIYLKIAAQNARTYKLEAVSRSIAETEMKDLPLWTNSSTTMKIE
ncbi:MAG: hypothetical protein KUG71_13305 [Porticoccaceae bacterium]|nr:hypothetical protein [Porticoccaceae bacterium]